MNVENGVQKDKRVPRDGNEVVDISAGHNEKQMKQTKNEQFGVETP